MNNDQNNLNQVGTITPNPVPPAPEPIAPTPTNTVVEGPAPVPPAPSAPEAVAAPAPVAPAPVSPEPVAAPVPPAPVNLQPEGVAAPAPAPEAANQGVVEPLMGTSLDNVTSFQQPSVPGAPVPPAGPAAPVPPNPNNQIGTIGGVPTPPPLPSEADAKPKKKSSKLLIIILAVILVLGVGFGLYYFLVLAKEKDKSITPFLTKLELGSFIDTTLVGNFVNLRGYTSAECKVDTNLNPNEFGTYEYTVTCGKATVNSTVEVSDTKAPEVTLKEVAVVPGTLVSPEDFISGCKDASNVTYQFESGDDYSAMDEGSYDVNIIASDAYGNSESFTAKLTIDEGAVEHFVTCPSSVSAGTSTTNYIFGITSEGEIYNVVKTSVWTYGDAKEYQDATGTYNRTSAIEEVTGNAKFDRSSYTITIESSVNTEEVASELNLDGDIESEEDLEEAFEGACIAN